MHHYEYVHEVKTYHHNNYTFVTQTLTDIPSCVLGLRASIEACTLAWRDKVSGPAHLFGLKKKRVSPVHWAKTIRARSVKLDLITQSECIQRASPFTHPTLDVRALNILVVRPHIF